MLWPSPVLCCLLGEWSSLVGFRLARRGAVAGVVVVGVVCSVVGVVVVAGVGARCSRRVSGAVVVVVPWCAGRLGRPPPRRRRRCRGRRTRPCCRGTKTCGGARGPLEVCPGGFAVGFFLLGEVRFRRLEAGLGLFEGHFGALRVERGQQLALRDLLALGHVDVRDRSARLEAEVELAGRLSCRCRTPSTARRHSARWRCGSGSPGCRRRVPRQGSRPRSHRRREPPVRIRARMLWCVRSCRLLRYSAPARKNLRRKPASAHKIS